MRKSLGIRNWEAAQKIVREWEGRTHGGGAVPIKHAFERFLADCEARHLRGETVYKYRLLGNELCARFGVRSAGAIDVSDLAEYRESWKLSVLTARNKIERIRRFFSFCMKRGWIEKNPAKDLELPKHSGVPTLPVEDADFEKLLAACVRFPMSGVHGSMTPWRVRAFLLLLRYSGMRIRDAAIVKRSSIQGDKLFIRTEKTNVPVWLPLPEFVLEALEPFKGEYVFWSGIGSPKSAVAAWERTFKTLGRYAGVKFKAHELRNSFARDLLLKGISVETVAVLLGNSPRIVFKHYAPFVKSRQEELESAIKRVWKLQGGRREETAGLTSSIGKE
jgi:integrase